MINEPLTLFEKEIDFIVRDILDSSRYDNSFSRFQEIERILEDYREEDINSFLEIYLSNNAEKYSRLDLQEGIDKINRYLRVLYDHILSLEQTSLSLYNQTTYQQENLRRLSNQALDKIAALKLYSLVNILSVILFGTKAVDWINTVEDSGYKRMTVADTANGMVLPIQRSEELLVASATVSDTSNGEPGDPKNLDRIFQRDDIKAVIDRNPTTYFEYSRIGNDGVTLELLLTLPAAAIINSLDISLVEYPFVQQARLVSSHYQLSNGQWASWSTEEFSIETDRVLYLNPVKTQRIRLLLSSNGSSPVRVGSDRFTRRSILGIKDIRVYRTEFLPKGQIISKISENVGGNKISLDKLSFMSTVSDLFKCDVFVRNTEDQWQLITPRETDENDFVNIKGQKFQAKLLFQLNDTEFKSNDSTIRSSRSIGDYSSFVASNYNPNRFSLNTVFDTNSLAVLQESVHNIGLRRFSLSQYRREATEEGVSYAIPSLRSKELDRLLVFVNGKLASRVNSAAGEGEYTVGLIDGKDYIKFGTLSPSSVVEASIRPELLTFKRQGSRYIATLREPIVPLTDNIKLEYLVKDQGEGLAALRAGEDFIDLGFKLISNVYISYRNIDGGLVDAGYTQILGEPSSPREALVGSKQFYLDYDNGIIYLSEPSTRTLFIKYKFKDIGTQTSYEIFKDQHGVPRAIAIAENNLKGISVIENISTSTERKATVDFIAGTTPYYWTSRDFTLLVEDAAYTAFLSHGHILEGSVKIPEFAFSNPAVEVPYIDGWTELHSGDYGVYTLGVPVLDDGTFQEWVISEYLFLNEQRGVYPLDRENFVNQQAVGDPLDNAGDWSYNAATGRLKVRSNAVTNDTQIGFFFKELDYEQVQYSIDYVTGRVFFNEEPNEFKIEYTVTPYRISYIPGIHVKDFELEGDTIIVRSSQLIPGQVAYVFYDKVLINSNVEELKNYYSPVMYSANFRVS